jgi:O-antigen/teichoic acid export membrane protein
MPTIYRQLSLQKLIFRFAPAVIVPAFVSICSIYILSRILEPKALGHYNLTLTLILVIQYVLFFPLDMALSRFHAIKERENSAKDLFKTVYTMIIYINAGIVFVACAVWLTIGQERLESVFGNMWIFALPLLVLRTIVSANQSIIRVSGDLLRFNIIECLCPILGLLAGLLLIWEFHDDRGAIAGLIIGLAIGAIMDMRTPFRLFVKHASFDKKIISEISRFVWPLIFAALVSSCLQYADRFLVDEFSGPEAVAIYIIAFSLVDRPLSMICLMITAGAFQKAMDVYAADGAEAARRQLGFNGAMLLAIAGPACIGLILSSDLIASVMVGPAIRDGLAPLIQIMAVTSLLRAMGAHYSDHTFHIPNRPFILFAIYAPVAIGNIILCLFIVPRYGMLGAAYCALVSQIVALLVGWLVAKRILPLWLPRREIVKIIICLAILAGVLMLIRFPAGWTGLIAEVAVGLITYGTTAILFDLGGLRSSMRNKVNLFLSKPKPTIAE